MNLLGNSCKRTSSLAIVTVLFLAAIVTATARISFAATSSSGIVIPLYTYPTDGSWAATFQARSAHPNVPIITVINPSNGPGGSSDLNYVQGVKNFQAAGIIVLGYVATGYASQLITSLESQISSYKNWYSVNGIMFDEMSSVQGNESYYSTLNTYVKSLGMTMTMGNPGTSVPSSYIGTLDSLFIFEQSGLPTLSYLSSYSGHQKSNFAYIGYTVSPLNAAFEAASSQYAGWLYITDAGLPNPYNVLPSYFMNEVAALDPSTATTTTAPVVTTTATKATTTLSTTTSGGGSIWQPTLNTSWQWQLTGQIDLSTHVQMYDIDAFGNTAATVATLHSMGGHVVCYISGGTFEDWRPDVGRFPASVLGSAVAGWAGERWLDVRQLTVLGPIMSARMDMCAQKGFDGIEIDNVDGYSNPTGFPLTYQDQLNYDTFMANAAHARGLSVGLKNDVGQVKDLLPYFNWALDESCFNFNECNTLLPFINAGKPVFQTQYETSQYCAQANALNFNGIVKHLLLDAWIQPCRSSTSTTTTTTSTTTSATNTATTTTTTGGTLATLSISTVNTSNQPITGFYIQSIRDNTVGTSTGGNFTPQTVTAIVGHSYSITVDDYGNNYIVGANIGTFGRTIANGGGGTTTFTLQGNTNVVFAMGTSAPANPKATFTVVSVDLNGKQFSGMWTTVNSNGVTLATGFTPFTFTGGMGVQYLVTVANWQVVVFVHWDDGTTNPNRALSSIQDTTLTAYYDVPGTPLTVTLGSVSMTGTSFSGMWMQVHSGGSLVASGFTPLSFNATYGMTYTVSAANWRYYVFDHWGDGITNATEPLTVDGPTTLTAYYRTPVTVTIQSVNPFGQAFSGMWTEVWFGGTLYRSGDTTLTFTATWGLPYTIYVANYQNYVFLHWGSGNGNTNPYRTVTPTEDTVIVAVYSTS